jgi:serine/threonine-protein kinase RsbW
MQIAAERKNLSTIRNFVAEKAQTAGANPEEIDSLIQAVDEAATNIIVHGYMDGAGFIEIDVLSASNSVTVILQDKAPFFDPTQVPNPDIHLPLEKRPVGGLGIYLVRQNVDEITHLVPPEGGNRLVLLKRIMGGNK